MSTTEPKQYEVTEENLNELQDMWLATAKKLFLEDGLLKHVAFVVSKKPPSEEALATIFGKESGVIPNNRESDDDVEGVAVSIIDLDFTWRSRYSILMASEEIPENVKTMAKMMLDIGISRYGEVDMTYRSVARGLMTAGGLHEKDIQKLAILNVCRVTEAIAAVMISEAWHAGDKGNKEDAQAAYEKAGSVEAMTSSVECIMCVLDAGNYKRLCIVDVIREEGHPKGKGPIKGLGHVQTTTDRAGNLEGRFMDLLPKKKTPASAV